MVQINMNASFIESSVDLVQLAASDVADLNYLQSTLFPIYIYRVIA